MPLHRSLRRRSDFSFFEAVEEHWGTEDGHPVAFEMTYGGYLMSFSEPAVNDHPLAPFYRALGHKVLSRNGVVWADAGRFSLMSVPCNQKLTLTKEEIQGHLRASGRMIAVFPTTEKTGITVTDFWLRDKSYDLSFLQRQFRQHVIKNEESCDVRLISWEELSQIGLDVNRNTMERRGLKMHKCIQLESWKQICAVASTIKGLEIFGCFYKGELAGYLVSWVYRDICQGIMLHRDSQYNYLGAGNSLVYGFTRQMIQRPEIHCVSMGRGWFPKLESLDRFRRHAGYVDETLRLGVVLHPRWEKILGSSLTHNVLKKLTAWTGGRLNLENDLEVLQAAAMTQL